MSDIPAPASAFYGGTYRQARLPQAKQARRRAPRHHHHHHPAPTHQVPLLYPNGTQMQAQWIELSPSFPLADVSGDPGEETLQQDTDALMSTLADHLTLVARRDAKDQAPPVYLDEFG